MAGQDGPLRVEQWSIDRLTEYVRNPRKNDAVVDQMAAAIREFGFRIPIVAKSDGTIVDGHLRYKAARKLGLTDVPVALADELSDAQIKAFRLLANRSASWAEWDTALLGLELGELQGLGYDLALTGFGEEELTALLADKTSGLTDPDDAPPLPEHPVSVMGDLWLLGRHRLLCGDSTVATDVERVLGGVEPQMVFADPPYGMKLDADYRSEKSALKMLCGKGIKGGRQYSNVVGDHADFRRELIDSIFASFAATAEMFLWGADYYSDLLTSRNDGSWIVWDKRLDETADRMYGSCFELCWSRSRHRREMVRVKWAGVFGVEKEPDRRRWHPTQKPVALARWFIERWSAPGDVVADPYVGSGTTILATEATGRVCHAIELSPSYIDVAAKRWQDFAGKQATLDGDGRTFAEVAAHRRPEQAAA